MFSKICVRMGLKIFTIRFFSPKNSPLKVLRAVMVYSRGVGHYSAHVFKEAILQYYTTHKLLPKGMHSSMECLQKWSLKMGLALRRMASHFNYNGHLQTTIETCILSIKKNQKLYIYIYIYIYIIYSYTYS